MKKKAIEKVLQLALEANGEEIEDDDEHESNNCLPDALIVIYDDWGESKQPEGYKIEIAEQHGGEGQGDEFWFVLSITNEKTTKKTCIRFTGWYASHHGHEFEDEDFEIVESRDVTVTQWFPV